MLRAFHRNVGALRFFFHNLAKTLVQKARCNTFLAYSLQFGPGVSVGYPCIDTSFTTQTLLIIETYTVFRNAHD